MAKRIGAWPPGARRGEPAAVKTKIGRRHHGRKMSLKAFEFAQVEEGYLCGHTNCRDHRKMCRSLACDLARANGVLVVEYTDHRPPCLSRIDRPWSGNPPVSILR